MHITYVVINLTKVIFSIFMVCIRLGQKTVYIYLIYYANSYVHCHSIVQRV